MRKAYIRCLRCGTIAIRKIGAFACRDACRVWLTRHPDKREELDLLAFDAGITTKNRLPVLAQAGGARWLRRQPPSDRERYEQLLARENRQEEMKRVETAMLRLRLGDAIDPPP